ncbi:MAG: adenylate/guanylate cyclase domain-containing protein [Pseudomonadota bacterium]
MSKHSDTAAREAENPKWSSRPIINWLLTDGRFCGDLETLTTRLGAVLEAGGAPVWRLRLSIRTLHPLITAKSAIWQKDRDETEKITAPHGLEKRPSYAGSPLLVINETRAPFRRSLEEDLTHDDHLVLHEIKAEGGTDYYGLPLLFSDEKTASVIFTTDRAGGFVERDLRHFRWITDVLAPVVEVYKEREIAMAIAEAYLGHRTGQLVLEGNIIRGDVETLDAAIFISDIRNWTGLSQRLPPHDMINLANAYFDVIVDAVENHGGEILKFIGDGVLAIFPVSETNTDMQACKSAVRAAQSAVKRAMAARDANQMTSDLEFGIGIHFGEVLYGNVGSATRLDFTVLGGAINLAARIEGLCDSLEHTVLISSSINERLENPAPQIAEQTLKGFETAVPVFAPSLE